MITANSVAVARARQTTNLNGQEVIERLNAALKDAPRKGQYDAIRDIINSNQDVAAIKAALGIKEYLSTHQARWLMINAYNGLEE